MIYLIIRESKKSKENKAITKLLTIIKKEVYNESKSVKRLKEERQSVDEMKLLGWLNWYGTVRNAVLSTIHIVQIYSINGVIDS